VFISYISTSSNNRWRQYSSTSTVTATAWTTGELRTGARDYSIPDQKTSCRTQSAISLGRDHWRPRSVEVRNCKAVTWQAWTRPFGLPDSYSRYMKVIRLSAISIGSLCPQELPLIHMYVNRLSWPQGHSVVGRIKSMKNPKDFFGNRTRTVPQPNAPPRSERVELNFHRNVCPHTYVIIITNVA
jgi:hypothetical protein